MAGNKQKAKEIPLRDRDHIIGYEEFAGYLGVSIDKAKRDYIHKGLVPQVYENTNRWEKVVVIQWLRDHNQAQTVKVGHGRSKKAAAIA